MYLGVPAYRQAGELAALGSEHKPAHQAAGLLPCFGFLLAERANKGTKPFASLALEFISHFRIES